ncbi:MAG: hypothetical protein NC489_08900 [Ruminococcus flavefaciens]|nr:hypothetical protein [Ruminococcus flavefaciens]
MPTIERFTIKDENIVFYEIETANEFKGKKLTDEEIAELEKKNEPVIDELKQYLVDITFQHTCACHQPRIIQREMAKPQIVPTNGPRQIHYQQSDFDNYVYGVVMMSDHGIHKGIPLLVVIQCQTCRSLQFIGDIRPLMRLLSVGFRDNLDAMEIPAGDMPGIIFEEPKPVTETKKPEFIMKDLETGKEIPADDLAEALFGKGNNLTGSLTLEDTGK